MIQIRMIKTRPSGETISSTMFQSFEHLIFGFVSYFDIRISEGHLSHADRDGHNNSPALIGLNQ